VKLYSLWKCNIAVVVSGIMKKISLVKVAFCVILVLTVGGALVIEVARANPVPWLTTPNQEKPTLTIDSPQNNTAYNAGSVYLNFTVTKPDSWNAVHIVAPYVGEMRSANVYLDGRLCDRYGYSGSVFVTLDQSASELNQTAPGAHTLNVTVLSYTYYRGPAYNGSHIVSDIQSSSGPVYEYPIVVSDIVYFTVVGETSPSPTPSPSIPEFPSWTILLPLSAMVAVAGLLVYHEKRNRSLVAV
jgi:hypothetical protein